MKNRLIKRGASAKKPFFVWDSESGPLILSQKNLLHIQSAQPIKRKEERTWKSGSRSWNCRKTLNLVSNFQNASDKLDHHRKSTRLAAD